MKKKILSLALALVFVFAFVPAATAVAMTPQYGSNGKFLAPIDPPAAGSIAVSTRAELEAIHNNMGGTYHLTANIDLFGAPWIQIGDDNTAFTGIFDGQGFVIRNLTISDNRQRGGLLGSASGATIKNVGLEGSSISTSANGAHAGGIVGYAATATVISNCYNEGSVTASGYPSYAGGICGYSNGKIDNCDNMGSVSVIKWDSYAGGICGSNDGTVNNSHNRGTIISSESFSTARTHSYAGGLCGNNSGTINNSYNIGSVTASDGSLLGTNLYAGGLCGNNSGAINNSYNAGLVAASGTTYDDLYAGGISGYSTIGAVIENCYNTGLINSLNGSIIGSAYAGGLCGYNGTGTVIRNSYNTGSVSVSGNSSSCVGGICGYNGGEINGTFWDKYSAQTLNSVSLWDEQIKGIGDGIDNTTSLTPTQLQTRATYADWTDFGSLWGFKSGTNNGYPVLRVFHPDIPPEAPNLNTANTWAYDGINLAFNEGFVPLDIQDNYQHNITRQEFCRMAVMWLEYKLGKSIDAIVAENGMPERMAHTFSDTSDPNILAAYRLGVTSGTAAPTADKPGLFTPNGTFDRQSAATMLRSACKVAGFEVDGWPDAGFADMGKVADWAKPGVNFVRANGIMSGDGTNFNPGELYSRQHSIITFNNIK